MPKTRHRGGQVKRPIDRSEATIGDRPQQGLEFLDIEEPNVEVAVVIARLLDELAGVPTGPLLLLGVGEKRVQEAEVVANRFRRLAVAELLGDEILHVTPTDFLERYLAEEGDEVDPQVGLVVLECGAPSAEGGQVLDVPRPDLLDGESLGDGWRSLKLLD